MKIDLVSLDTGWQGLYINGNLVLDGYKFKLDEVLKVLELSYRYIEFGAKTEELPEFSAELENYEHSYEFRDGSREDIKVGT